MCRLLIASNNAIRNYHRAYGLHNLLSHLERECGGHGNGFTLHKDGKLIRANKGVDLSIPEVARIALEEVDRYDTIVFHTRIASVSGISSENCHPFIHGNDVMAMNGTLYELSELASALGITDTQAVFELIKNRHLDQAIRALKTLSAVFIGVCDGSPYALKNGGALVEWAPANRSRRGMCWKSKTDFFFVSSLPRDVADKERLRLDSSFVFVDGVRSEPMKKSTKTSTHFSTYDYMNSYADAERDFYLDHDTPSYTSSLRASQEDEAYADGYKEGFEDGYREALQTSK